MKNLDNEKKTVVELRLKDYSIRKTVEATEIPYLKVLKILGETQVDDEEE